jgi:CheY-like chemotaxis protein
MKLGQRPFGVKNGTKNVRIARILNTKMCLTVPELANRRVGGNDSPVLTRVLHFCTLSARRGRLSHNFVARLHRPLVTARFTSRRVLMSKTMQVRRLDFAEHRSPATRSTSCAGDGAAACRARVFQPHLVLDLMMPIADGFSVLASLRRADGVLISAPRAKKPTRCVAFAQAPTTLSLQAVRSAGTDGARLALLACGLR